MILPERIRALKAKAAAKQAAVDACQGHLWLADYTEGFSTSWSAVCVRCGERRGIKDILPDEQWAIH